MKLKVELTKIECLDAVNYLYDVIDGELREDAKETLKELIEEHFDNFPLKFEDLNVSMWIWDNKEKEYIKIQKILTKEDCSYLYHDENKKVFMSWTAIEFEENRFYLRENQRQKKKSG